MIAVLREQVSEWRNHIVTQALMQELTTEMEKYVAEMVNRKVPDNERDQWIRAYIAVARDVLGFQPEIVQSNDLQEVRDVED